QAPVSITPTITPSPALAAPPSCWYRTGAPMNWGLESVRGLRAVAFWTPAPGSPAGEAKRGAHLVAARLRRDPAVDGPQSPTGRGSRHPGAEGAQELALDSLDVAVVVADGGVLGVEPLPGDRRAGGGITLDAALVAGQRVVVELD